MSYVITRYKNDTYDIEVILQLNDVPIDFTLNNNAIFSFAKNNILYTINGTNGTVDGFISFPFPSDVQEGEYTYDIQVTDINGKNRTFVKDTLNIIKNIAV